MVALSLDFKCWTHPTTAEVIDGYNLCTVAQLYWRKVAPLQGLA